MSDDRVPCLLSDNGHHMIKDSAGKAVTCTEGIACQGMVRICNRQYLNLSTIEDLAYTLVNVDLHRSQRAMIRRRLQSALAFRKDWNVRQAKRLEKQKAAK